MKKLVILACAREHSNTLRLFNELRRQKNWTTDDLEIIDLYQENIPYLTEAMLKNITKDQQKIIDQFTNFEECIIVYPTWNWNIPGILKSYLDLIMIANKTFKVNKFSMHGLTQLKNVTIINTTGFKKFPKPIAYLFNINYDRFYLKNMLKILGAKKINIISLGNFGAHSYSDIEIEKFIKKHSHKV